MNNYNDENNLIDIMNSEMKPIEKEPKQKKNHTLVKKVGAFILCGTLCGVAAGSAFAGTTYFAKQYHSSNTELSSTADQNTVATLTSSPLQTLNTYTANSSGADMTVPQIASQGMPSVVAITNIGVADVITFFGQMQQQTESSGSGVIIGRTDTELLIVTNYHVIADSNNLTVVFSHDESSSEPNAVEAYIKGYDEDKDLAVIAISRDKITDDILNQISIATIGDSNELVLGEQVVAIGNALGYGQSVTTGIVSALNRAISATSTSYTNAEDANKYIQTDTAINPGNSGGALFNLKGELIGINTAKIASDEVEGMGYAIPISDVYDLIEDMMNETARTEVIDTAKRGYLGISGADISSEAISSYGFPEGIYVSTVTQGSAADLAGIEKGNIITKFDGKSVKSISQLQKLLTYYSAGEKVTITIKVPDGSTYKEKELEVTLSTSANAGISNSESNQNPYNNGNGEQYYNNDYSDFFGNFDGFSN